MKFTWSEQTKSNLRKTTPGLSFGHLHARLMSVAKLSVTVLLITGITIAGLASTQQAEAAREVVPPDSCFNFFGGTIYAYNDYDGIGDPCPKHISIPSTIGGQSVVEIYLSAFAQKKFDIRYHPKFGDKYRY